MVWDRLKKSSYLTARPCQDLFLLRHRERCVPAHPARSVLLLWQVKHWGEERWARAESRWFYGWFSISSMKESSDVLIDNYILDISTCEIYTHCIAKKPCFDSSPELCGFLSPSAEADTRCRRTQRACVFKMFITRGGPQRGLLKAQLKLLKPHLTASQMDLNLWRSAQQHRHISNNLPAEPEDTGVSCGLRWTGETKRLHVQTLAVNVGGFFSIFWWRTALRITRATPITHTEHFKHFD